MGSRSSTSARARQTETALFWYDVAAKEWNLAAQQGLADRSADEWRAARTLAVLNISLADTVIANFDTKFHFNYWRPITAIRAGDDDGNRATRGDAELGAAVRDAAVPRVLLDARGDRRRGGDRARSRARRSAHVHRHQSHRSDPNLQAVQRSRLRRRHLAIYCGIHFRTRDEHGVHDGRAGRRYVDKTLLQPPC